MHLSHSAEQLDKEGLDLFNKIKRPYSIEDIINFQTVLLEFEGKRKKDNAKYVFGWNNFYQFLTSFRPEIIQEDRSKIVEADFERLEVGIFIGWRENLLKHKVSVLSMRPKLAEVVETLEREPVPKTLEQLRDFYRRFPSVEEMSALSYQEGIGEKQEIRSNFVHVKLERYNAYQQNYPKPEVRLYLNPPKSELPKLAMALTGEALRLGVRLYYKFVDDSFQSDAKKPDRSDRIVIFTNKEDAPKLAGILTKIKAKRPEWFRDDLPNLVAKVDGGIGIAADPSDFQKAKLAKKETSFNAVRATFLEEVWGEVIRKILLKNRQVIPRGGRALQEIFNDHFEKSLKSMKIEGNTRQLYQNQIWAADLNRQHLQSDILKLALKEALSRTMQDVVPFVPAGVLMHFVKKEVQEKAPEFGINPENVAFNI